MAPQQPQGNKGQYPPRFPPRSQGKGNYVESGNASGVAPLPPQATQFNALYQQAAQTQPQPQQQSMQTQLQQQPQQQPVVTGQATFVTPGYTWFAQSTSEGQYSASQSRPEGQYSAGQGVSLNPSVESALSRGDVVQAKAWMTGDIDAHPDDDSAYETDDDLEFSDY